jgi:hypothetical protein
LYFEGRLRPRDDSSVLLPDNNDQLAHRSRRFRIEHGSPVDFQLDPCPAGMVVNADHRSGNLGRIKTGGGKPAPVGRATQECSRKQPRTTTAAFDASGSYDLDGTR